MVGIKSICLICCVISFVSKSFNKSKIIDILQEMIERGMEIEVENIKGKWCEIDTIQDLEIAKKIFTN